MPEPNGGCYIKVRQDLQFTKREREILLPALLDKGSCCVSQTELAHFLDSNESPASAFCPVAGSTEQTTELRNSHSEGALTYSK